MPQPVGGYSPNQSFIQNQGIKMPQPYGGFNLYGNNNYTNNYNYNNNNNNNNINNNNNNEYEYITDEEGDFVEDENGTIYTLEEAQKRGLIGPSNGERGIGKKILLGTVLLGGINIIRKKIKKKKRVKKQNYNYQTPQNVNYNNNNGNNTIDDRPYIYPFLKNNTSNTNSQTQYPDLPPKYPNQTPNVYGQNNYAPPPSYQQCYPYGRPLYPDYNTPRMYSGYCYNNCKKSSTPLW